MRLVTFRPPNGGKDHVGVIRENIICDVTGMPGVGSTMLAIVSGGSEVLEALKRAADTAPKFEIAAIELCAPIPKPPRNIFCIGKNYREHANEFHASGFDASSGRHAVPDSLIVFTKPSTTVIGPNQSIDSRLDPTGSIDYENELAVIIGVGGRGIAPEHAYGHVFGYTIVNDITARILQRRHKQWFLGKGIDTFCPMGPCIVTADEILDPAVLRLQTRVNGELRQDAVVSDLIFDIPAIIATISRSITLESGDIIATGTPAGVGVGFNPPRYLVAGDRVSASIDAIGTLDNHLA